MTWIKKKLGEIITLQRGFDLPSQHRKNGEFPIISSSGITDVHSEFKCTGPGVITGRYGTIGEVFFVKEQYWPLNTTLFVSDFKGNNPRYVYYLLGMLNLKSMVATGAVPGVNRNHLHQLDVLVTTEPAHQQLVADILSAYDDLIENNLRRIQLLEDAARCRYMMLKEENNGWEKVNLYDFADVQMGYAFDSKYFNEKGEGIPIIRIRDIPGQWTKSFSTQEADQVYLVLQGDLLIGMDGEFHMNEWCGQEGYLVQRVCRLRTKDPLYHSYLRQALIEQILFYQNTISGATVAHLGAKHLKEIFVPVPPETIYSPHLEEMNKMRLLRINLSNQNINLRQARDILLPRLMSGEIDVTSVAVPRTSTEALQTV